MADDSVVALSVDQRQPLAGEPTCVVCGRYGAYVCDVTDEDVCSLECRDVTTQRHQQRNHQLSDEERNADTLRSRLGVKIAVRTGSEAEKVDGGSAGRQPTPMVNFDQETIGGRLPEALLDNLFANGLERPTPVQMQTIPCVLQRRNVLVSAPTGTGKTAAYLVPIIAQILLARESGDETIALVIAPIRELAIQIETVAKCLMRGIREMKTALLVGGFPIPTQRYRLQCGVQLLVATPGRFLDILTNYAGGDVILMAIRTIVVDEVDMMLDVGFRPQISQIVSLVEALAQQHHHSVQMLFFSATVSDEVEGLVQQAMKGQSDSRYLRIDVCREDNKTSIAAGARSFNLNPRVQYQVRWADDKVKKKELFAFMEGRGEESTLVFVSSKIGSTMLAEAIKKRCGIHAASIHADKSQKERMALLEAFINLETPVLVSTNVLSRGMNLLHVQNVVIYDSPNKSKTTSILSGEQDGERIPAETH